MSNFRVQPFAITRVFNLHTPRVRPDVVVVTSPRSGSTWLMEIILQSDAFLVFNEPFDLRRPNVRRHLPGMTWAGLYDASSRDRILTYLRDLSDGRLWQLKPDRANPYYRLRTSRSVFKLINACEDRLPAIAESLGARMVFMLRHPCAVSVSREELPRLDTFMSDDVLGRFSAPQQQLARRVADGDSFFLKAVLHWCFENAMVVRDFADDWLMVYYEAMVADPATEVRRVARYLDCDAAAETRMLAQVDKASLTTAKSDAATQAIFADSEARTERLLSKWKAKAPADAMDTVDELLVTFGLDRFYRAGETLPVGHALGRDVAA